MSELLKSITVRIVGVSFNNDDGSSRQDILSTISDGEALLLEYFEYENEPAYAVKTALGEQIGNLPKGLSADIYRRFKDCYFAVQVNHMTGGDGGMKYGCVIDIDIYDCEPDFSRIFTASTATTDEHQTSTSAVNNIPPTAPAVPNKSLRTYGTIYIVLGIVLALLGLLLLIVFPIFGIIAIAGGVFSVIIGRKYKKS